VVGSFLVAGAASGCSSSTENSANSTAASCPVSSVASKVLPSVVTITARNAESGATGSGEVIDDHGNVLTNNHVISIAANGGTISVLFYDGEAVQATLVGRDPQSDIAVIRVAGGPTKPIPIGSSASLEVGQPVVAIGSPLGLTGSVTSGIVSATDRTVEVPSDNGQMAILASAVQTDAAINPGNSGGALVDCEAKLIGVPSAGALAPSTEPGAGTSTGSIGLGFAIPVDNAMEIAGQLISTGSVTHGYFGMTVATMPPSPAQPDGGVYVQSVVPAGPSEAAGIRAGDVITEIDGVKATSSEQIAAATISKRPGESVKLTYRRAGATGEATVVLWTAP
jgi:putative serine protease PepD